MTMLTDESVEVDRTASLIDQARQHLQVYRADRMKLDRIHLYLLGQQPNPSIPATGVPDDVKRLAYMSRVNVLGLVVGSVAQSLFVDGYRTEKAAEDAPAWSFWQQQRMDSRQIAVHRAALAYGVSYVTVTREDDAGPKIQGHSPRRFVALYGREDAFPRSGMAIERAAEGFALQLYDEEQIHEFHAPTAKGISDLVRKNVRLDFVSSRPHGYDVVPVVRFVNEMDLDEDQQGEVERLIPIQDQIDHTTFGLLVAQQYAAFRQRYLIGFLAQSEEEKLKASAARLWTFEDEDVKVGEFEQTDLAGYLESREASLRHAASLSQTPAHELLGSLVNLSAEALVAAEASQRRKITERQMSFGESWEQVLALVSDAEAEADVGAQVRWRDTESRALAATVDALGKMAQMLGIPVEELWEKVPGVSQQDVDRWKAAVANGDPIASLEAMLARQGAAA